MNLHPDRGHFLRRSASWCICVVAYCRLKRSTKGRRKMRVLPWQPSNIPNVSNALAFPCFRSPQRKEKKKKPDRSHRPHEKISLHFSSLFCGCCCCCRSSFADKAAHNGCCASGRLLASTPAMALWQ